MKEARKKECAAGCWFCCCQRVYITPKEAKKIAAWIDSGRDRDTWAALLEDHRRQLIDDDLLAARYLLSASHVTGGASLPRPLPARVQWAIGTPCAFLTSAKKCAIYDVRPWACSSYLSEDARACAEACGKNTGFGNPYSDLGCYRSGEIPKRIVVAKRRNEGVQLSQAVLTALGAQGRY